MSDIASFVAKKHRQVKVETMEDKIKKLPWFRRPIEKTAFSSREGRDGKLYVHHCEWSDHVWIGPYETKKDVDGIIQAYVDASLKSPLDKAPFSPIHSVWVEDRDNFFVKKA